MSEHGVVLADGPCGLALRDPGWGMQCTELWTVSVSDKKLRSLE
jgi:hypothetical protein